MEKFKPLRFALQLNFPSGLRRYISTAISAYL